MYAYAEKPKENKSRAISNPTALKESNKIQCFGFEDNRPEAAAQRKLVQLASIGENYLGQKGAPIQGVFNFVFQALQPQDMPQGSATRVFEQLQGMSNRASLLHSNDVFTLTSISDLCRRWLAVHSPEANGTGTENQRIQVAGLQERVNQELAHIDSRQNGTGDDYASEKNDLLYGTHTDRMRYEPRLGQINAQFGAPIDGLQMMQPAPIDEPIIADFMNNLFLGTRGAYGDSILDTPRIKPENQAFQDFTFFFHRYLGAAVPQDNTGLHQSTRIATACKFGIWLTAKQGRKIRFVLDDIDSAERQTRIANGTANQYTARELRFIRSSWQDADIRENVKFYVAHHEVLPPWERYAVQWHGFTQENLELPDEAEKEVTAASKLTETAGELQTVMQPMQEQIAFRGELIERVHDLTARARAIQGANTLGVRNRIGALFGLGGDEVARMQRNLQQSQFLMAEAREVLEEIAEVTARLNVLRDEMMAKVGALQILAQTNAMVEQEKSEFVADTPRPLPQNLF